MALKRWVLPLIIVLASLLTAASCADNPFVPNPTPAPNYTPSEAVKVELQEAAQAFGRDIPVPTYLPQGYAITEAQFKPELYSNDHVELTLASPKKPDIIMSITWFHGVFRILPGSENYTSFDMSGGPGTYSKWATLNYLGDYNDLWWDWTPVTLSPDEPRPLEYYEMVLSASKDVPGEELVNIAKFVRLP
jgi:hypothetical protein